MPRRLRPDKAGHVLELSRKPRTFIVGQIQRVDNSGNSLTIGIVPGVTWADLRRLRPDIAETGFNLIYHFGIGLGFLGTVRADGGPRVHPISPIVTDDGLYGFILPGPKLADLQRDPRYALHSETIPPPRQDDGFYVTGRVVEIVDRDLRGTVADQFMRELGRTELWPEHEQQSLFEFRIEVCLLTLTDAHEGLPAGPTIWRADATP